MELERFRKAGRYLATDKVKITHKGNRHFSFKVDEYDLRLSSNGENMCTCHNETYDNQQRRACSHVLAAQCFLAIKLLLPSEIKTFLKT